ncbi:MAG TPA: hypothetical protein VGE72_11290 [Azospirillum sp.]
MGSRCRIWVVLADGMRLRILQATDERAGFEEILHRNGGTIGPAAATRRFETCAAHILNQAAFLKLYDALVLAGPPSSLHRLAQDLNASANGRLVVTVPADLLDLADPVLLARLRSLLKSHPGINHD